MLHAFDVHISYQYPVSLLITASTSITVTVSVTAAQASSGPPPYNNIGLKPTNAHTDVGIAFINPSAWLPSHGFAAWIWIRSFSPCI